MEEDEDDDVFSEKQEAWRRDNLRKPEPEEFEPPEGDEDEAVDLENDFPEKDLQVIVKLANIQLTPEKPTYDGGSWHVEGQLVGFRRSSVASQQAP